MNRHYKNWLVRAGLGLAITGFGVCLISEAAMTKYSGAPTMTWVLYGTAALCVFNAGLSVFGSAIISRVHYEREQEAARKAG